MTRPANQTPDGQGQGEEREPAVSLASTEECPEGNCVAQAAQTGLETPELGQDIAHFHVIRVLGHGGMGRVLLARDNRLGRLVALKLIRSDRLAPNRIQALIEEAQTTARLSHPNIVTIYDVGQIGEMPYLALEYVEGDTLRERMAERLPTPREALRIALAIARALQAAHAAQVTHCDLKPENVLMPRDGRLRVVDFGIAAVLETLEPQRPPGSGARTVAGTPQYMAPEQFLGEAPKPPVDIFALGVLLQELLSGFRPFEGPGADNRPLLMRVVDDKTPPRPLQGVEPAVQHLVLQMLHRRPESRPTAEEVAQRIENLLSLANDDHRQQEAPFRGLMAFEERHSALFFGRDAEVDALLERMRTATVVPVVGPSGAGKSSLIQAGLLPRLREAGGWTVVTLRPGSHPLRALAARLLTLESGVLAGQERDAAAELIGKIAESPAEANLAVHRMARLLRTRILLFVDQLEEVATMGASAAEAQAFLDAVASAADPIDDVVQVVMTLRDDFLGRVASGAAMQRALSNVQVVRRLDGHALRQAVLRPLERLGFRWDPPEVVDRMVEELAGEPAALPLLQFACAMLWDRRDQVAKTLRLSDYLALGGVAGALAQHADAVLDGLSPLDVPVARQLLLRLVSPAGTRRSVDRSALLEDQGERGALVLERLTQARLLTARRSREGGDAQVELAHESLVRTWPRLERWLEESSEERSALAELEAAAALWHGRGRHLAEVWPLEGVRDARRRIHDRPQSRVAREFLEVSEQTGMAAQRRKRWLLGAAAAALLAITAASLYIAAEFQRRESETRAQAEQITLAAADMGLAKFDVHLVNWDPERLVAVEAPPESAADLHWSLWDPDPVDPQKPGRPRDPRFVHTLATANRLGHREIVVETRSGAAFLLIEGRGTGGQKCSPARIQIRALPGYADRSAGPKAFALTVPTCQASLAGTVAIPGGPFIDSGVGDPPIPGHLPTTPERRLDLPTFRIDRTEVPNAQFAIYAQNQGLTGHSMPQYPASHLESGTHLGDRPVAGVDWYAAAAFCAWMGKRLPASAEWTKAGRGGLTLDAAAAVVNPMPRRNLPWGQQDERLRMNLLDTGDPWPRVAPVAALPDGASPYGVLGMADNVMEWQGSDSSDNRRQVEVRGSEWFAKVADGMHSLAVTNSRDRVYLSYGLGFRCAMDSADGLR